MVFRATDRRQSVRGSGASVSPAVVAEALSRFGGDVEPQPDGSIVAGGHRFVYDATAEPHFVLVPECDTCGTHELDQFPLEAWELDGVPVRAQARASCRDCRFIAIANG